MMLFFALLLSLALSSVHGGLISGLSSLFKGGEDDTTLLPHVLPHPDTAYLISFESDDYDHCRQMQPVLRRLEEDLGTLIRRINIARRKEFLGVLEAMGHNDCGTLPFYYNRRTGQAICGATSYMNLRRWGTGDLRHSFIDPPEGLSHAEDHYIGPSSRKGVGAKGFLLDKLQSLERRGKARAERVVKLEALRKAKLEERARLKAEKNKRQSK